MFECFEYDLKVATIYGVSVDGVDYIYAIYDKFTKRYTTKNGKQFAKIFGCKLELYPIEKMNERRR